MKSWSIFIVIVIAFAIHHVNTCGKGKKKGGKGKGSNDKPKNPPSAVKSMLGDNVKTQPYDGSGYDAKNGKADHPDDLHCDFSGPCCWKNTKPPFDTMDYALASGDPDPDCFQKSFGTSQMPSGNYLITASDVATGEGDKAELQSCVIHCADDSIQVTVKHWASQGVKLQVCEIAESDPKNYVACMDLPSGGPGPDTVSLPPGSDVYIAIVASNLVAKGPNMAIIKEITVKYPECSSSTQPPQTAAPTDAQTQPQPVTQPPTTTPSLAECQKLVNDFESGMGNYGPGSGPNPRPSGNTINFQQAGPNRFKNPATGVAQSPDKSHYAAAYVLPKENAYMECPSNFDQERTIKFQEYKATEGLAFKCCCDSLSDCPYDSGKSVEKTDFRQWYQGRCTCKQGTQKVIFFADNQGPNEGGVGIDNIQVFDATGTQRIC